MTRPFKLYKPGRFHGCQVEHVRILRCKTSLRWHGCWWVQYEHQSRTRTIRWSSWVGDQHGCNRKSCTFCRKSRCNGHVHGQCAAWQSHSQLESQRRRHPYNVFCRCYGRPTSRPPSFWWGHVPRRRSNCESHLWGRAMKHDGLLWNKCNNKTFIYFPFHNRYDHIWSGTILLRKLNSSEWLPPLHNQQNYYGKHSTMLFLLQCQYFKSQRQAV